MRNIVLPDGRWNVQYMQRVLATDPIAYWMLDEKQGNVAYDVSRNEFHGAYTGVTLGQPGIGDGRTAPFFDGANDFVDIHSAALKAIFDGAGGIAGTMAIWAKVFNIGVWTDGNLRWAFGIENNFNTDRIAIYLSDNDPIIWEYVAGAVQERRIRAELSIAWMYLVMTWDKNAGVNGEKRSYFNGVQEGATQTALGVWADNLGINKMVIGALNTGVLFPWHGYLAHAALWDTPLTPAQIADLAVV